MMLAVAEPVSDSDEETAEPSTFWKLVTMVEAPEVWSARPRLTVAAAFSSSVLVPEPPSIEVSDP